MRLLITYIVLVALFLSLGYLYITIDLVAVVSIITTADLRSYLISCALMLLSVFLSSAKLIFWFNIKIREFWSVGLCYISAFGVNFLLGFLGSASARIGLLSQNYELKIGDLIRFSVIDKAVLTGCLVTVSSWILFMGLNPLFFSVFCLSLFCALIFDVFLWRRKQLFLSIVVVFFSIGRYATLANSIGFDFKQLDLAIMYALSQVIPLPLGGFGLKEVLFSSLFESVQPELILALGTLVLSQGLLFVSLSICLTVFHLFSNGRRK